MLFLKLLVVAARFYKVLLEISHFKLIHTTKASPSLRAPSPRHQAFGAGDLANRPSIVNRHPKLPVPLSLAYQCISPVQHRNPVALNPTIILSRPARTNSLRRPPSLSHQTHHSLVIYRDSDSLFPLMKSSTTSIPFFMQNTCLRAHCRASQSPSRNQPTNLKSSPLRHILLEPL